PALEARAHLRGEGSRGRETEGRNVRDPPVHAGLLEATGEGGGPGGSAHRESELRRRHGVRCDPSRLAQALSICECVGALRTVPWSEGRTRSPAEGFGHPDGRASQRVTSVRAFVTGGTGLVGRPLVEALLQKNWEVPSWGRRRRRSDS